MCCRLSGVDRSGRYACIRLTDRTHTQDSDISWVFDLPTDFATVLDTDKLRAMPK